MTAISVGDSSAEAREKSGKMGSPPAGSPPAESPLWLRTSSAASYAVSSFAIMAVNKEVLTVKRWVHCSTDNGGARCQKVGPLFYW